MESSGGFLNRMALPVPYLSIHTTVDTHQTRTPAPVITSAMHAHQPYRHFFSWIGCRPASPKNIKRIFSEGSDCAITVGGIAGAFSTRGCGWDMGGHSGSQMWTHDIDLTAPHHTLTDPCTPEMYMVGGEEEKVYLKKHKGFVREAIKVPYTINHTYISPLRSIIAAACDRSGRPTYPMTTTNTKPERGGPGAGVLLRQLQALQGARGGQPQYVTHLSGCIWIYACMHVHGSVTCLVAYGYMHACIRIGVARVDVQPPLTLHHARTSRPTPNKHPNSEHGPDAPHLPADTRLPPHLLRSLLPPHPHPPPLALRGALYCVRHDMDMYLCTPCINHRTHHLT